MDALSIVEKLVMNDDSSRWWTIIIRMCFTQWLHGEKKNLYNQLFFRVCNYLQIDKLLLNDVQVVLFRTLVVLLRFWRSFVRSMFEDKIRSSSRSFSKF